MASPSDPPLNKTVSDPCLTVFIDSRAILNNTERKTNYMQPAVHCGSKPEKSLWSQQEKFTGETSRREKKTSQVSSDVK